MDIGRIIGRVVATRKVDEFTGFKICVVQPMGRDNKPEGSPIIAVDPESMVGEGEMVYYVTGGDASYYEEGKKTPSDATIVGIIDSVNL